MTCHQLQSIAQFEISFETLWKRFLVANLPLRTVFAGVDHFAHLHAVMMMKNIRQYEIQFFYTLYNGFNTNFLSNVSIALESVECKVRKFFNVISFLRESD